MTRADIEQMLHELAATRRDLEESGRVLHRTAQHLLTASEHLQHMATRIEAAVTAGLKHLHDDDA
jgi:isochorismate synthase EntC